MKQLRQLLTLGLMAACLALPVTAGASGSYTARPPQPGVAGKSLDRAKYSLGQKLFTGKVQPSGQAGQADAATQNERLKRLQGLLPEKTAAKKDLPALAGKLTGEQLDALDYYVTKRYAK
jgi:hypothetical protein